MYEVSLFIVCILDSGHSLQCYSCVNPTGQLYSQTQCNISQVNFTCVAPDDTCLDIQSRFWNYTGDEVETKLQLKACGTKEYCKRMGNEACANTGGKCKYTCCQDDLCNNGSFSSSLDALKCYHCEGAGGSNSHIFNHSTPLNMSYTGRQCYNEITEFYCPREYKCAIIRRVFKPDKNNTFELERRSCISNAEIDALQKVCDRTEHKAGNGTSLCFWRVCDIDLCNLAPCANLAPFVIAFTTMFGMIGMRWEVVPINKGRYEINRLQKFFCKRLFNCSFLPRGSCNSWCHWVSLNSITS